MDAVELIEKHIDVERILNHYDFDKVRPSGNFIRSCCGIHGGDNPMSFVINQENGLWTCHTNCGNGNIFHLVQKIEGISFPEAVYKLAQILGLDIENLKIVAKVEDQKKELKTWMKTMQEMNKKVEFETLNFIDEFKAVTKYKGFQRDTLEHFGLLYFDKYQGVSKSGDPFISYQRLAFPIKMQGKTIGVSLRATRAEHVPKWLHQPSNISTSEILYNYDSAIGQSEVIVVEGITDVWAYHEIGKVAVATYGAHITDAQRRLLLRLGAKLIFSFDGDKAGHDATRKAYDMFCMTSDIAFITIPEGQDPESIERDELNGIYKNSTKRP